MSVSFLRFLLLRRDHDGWRAALQWCAIVFAGVVALVLPVPAESAQRIVSMNVCADVLLIDLVEPNRVLALSRNARDTRLNPATDKAKAYPQTGRASETVLQLKPDLVLAGAFAGRDAKAFLRDKGIEVHDVPIANSLDEVETVILGLAEKLGVLEKATSLLKDAKQLPASVDTRPRALVLERRGIVAGRGTLMDDLLKASGFENAAPFDGYRKLDVEGLMQIEADAIIRNAPPDMPADQGEAMLQHRAWQRHLADAQEIILPGNLTVCASFHIYQAIAILKKARTQQFP